ncbi:MAG TPA: HlyD family efflux transporter periplasmic adaptor subunit [Steroidobacteraceae bacterium]|jgi:HlyD family secretion protein
MSKFKDYDSDSAETLRMRDTAGQDRELAPPPAWRRHRRLIIVALAGGAALVVLAVWLLRFSGINSSVDRSRLTIATVERGLFVRDVAADGQVVAASSPTLYAIETGIISLRVHAGDAVKKGQVLAVIDSPDLTAKLSQEQASLESMRVDWQRAQLDAASKLRELSDKFEQAKVDRTTAQRESDRSAKAYELGAYTELQALQAKDGLEKADFAFRQAQADYAAAPRQTQFDVSSKRALFDRQQLVVSDLRRQVAALQVQSPVDGRVGQVQVAERASVAKDAPLLTVIDLSQLEVEIKVPESLARDLQPGMSATLEGDGRQWQATLSGVSPEVVAGEVTARLRFTGTQPVGLRQSQRLAVRILIDKRDNVLTVERGSFVDQDAGFAYVVRDGVAQRLPVRLGAQSVQKVEILNGLNIGDEVVVSGSDAFNGADRVIVTH